jgi:hypothetical protein
MYQHILPPRIANLTIFSLVEFGTRASFELRMLHRPPSFARSKAMSLGNLSLVIAKATS